MLRLFFYLPSTPYLYQLTFDLPTTLLTTLGLSMMLSCTAFFSHFADFFSLKQTQFNNLLFRLTTYYSTVTLELFELSMLFPGWPTCLSRILRILSQSDFRYRATFPIDNGTPALVVVSEIFNRCA